MKNWNFKSFIGIGVGLTIGMILYDYLAHDSIGWIRAIFVGILVMALSYVVPLISGMHSKPNNRNS